MKSGTLMTALLVFIITPLQAGDAEVEIKPQTVRKWMEFLAGDDMLGRANGSPELDKAAWWLARRYKEAGLEPLPGRKHYFHDYVVKTRDGKEIEGMNVLGWLEGSDPDLKDEYIMLSAHYDHVGVKEEGEGDLIYNGADDDASGVLTTLGVVTVLQRMMEDPNFIGLKRSVLVVSWGAEEIGLLGSKEYVKKPIVPVEKMNVNLNFELVGHTKKTGKRKVFMVGGDYSNLDETVKPIITDYGWELGEDPFPKMNLFFRSDNVNFAMLEFDRKERTAKGVPAHTFSTWGGGDHYHATFDDPDRIDYENMADLINMMARIVIHLANDDTIIQWTENETITFSRP